MKKKSPHLFSQQLWPAQNHLYLTFIHTPAHPPDFQAKTFTPSISTNFNSFSDKMIKTQTMSENGEIYTTSKNFPASSDGRDKSHLCPASLCNNLLWSQCLEGGVLFAHRCCGSEKMSKPCRFLFTKRMYCGQSKSKSSEPLNGFNQNNMFWENQKAS